MNLEIIDDFLNPGNFKSLENLFFSDVQFFPWYYSGFCLDKSDNRKLEFGKTKYQFTHTLFHSDPIWNGRKSEYFDLFVPLLHKLNIKDLIRIKVNCNPRTFFKTNTGFHMDTEFSNVKTAVYYINTNNGGTKIKDGPFIKSVGNRVAIFDSNVLHAGVTCTDRNVRILINVNYT